LNVNPDAVHEKENLNKRKNREIQKEKDPVTFKNEENIRRKSFRGTKLNLNPDAVHEKENLNKRKNREAQKEDDPDKYRFEENARKKKLREINLKIDPASLRKIETNKRNSFNAKRTRGEDFFDLYEKFRCTLRFGILNSCECCHKRCYNSGLKVFKSDWLSEVKNKHVINIENNNLMNLFAQLIDQLQNSKDRYLCVTCFSKIEKGKFPALSILNGLQLFDTQNHPELEEITELENALIARNLLFTKFYFLPKSRQKGIKDRIVNVPLSESDVISTVQRLPRLPEESNVVPVIFKRRLGYVHGYLQSFIKVPRIFKALKTLNRLGNKHYDFKITDEKEYQQTLEDHKRKSLMFNTEDCSRNCFYVYSYKGGKNSCHFLVGYG
jgi:hypothetical protein